MLNLDLWFFAIAGPAVIFAGISKGGFGSGAAFAASSMLALVVEPAMALGVMLPLLMLIDAATLRPYWGRWRLREAMILILGGLPGVALGAMLFRVASPDLLRLLIGLVSVGFVLWQIASRSGKLKLGTRPMPDWGGGIAGLTAGFTSFISHAGGPPAAVFLLARGLDKTAYQATTVLVFWAINIAKFIPYAALDMFTQATTQANLALAPFALLGAWLGVRAHRIVPERLFFAVTYVALTATGLKLIWDGLT
ncbi:sulfite exporter TauE/SafE family protein [Sulfitobacter sp. HNIBRBA3233]|uniref:sulfite exporter TauE/SafE family protein n=1 Tax=Sulfitobacter marinivivus TaxID=3158558 RepID=UPI0032DEF86B